MPVGLLEMNKEFADAQNPPSRAFREKRATIDRSLVAHGGYWSVCRGSEPLRESKRGDGGYPGTLPGRGEPSTSRAIAAGPLRRRQAREIGVFMHIGLELSPRFAPPPSRSPVWFFCEGQVIEMVSCQDDLKNKRQSYVRKALDSEELDPGSGQSVPGHCEKPDGPSGI